MAGVSGALGSGFSSRIRIAECGMASTFRTCMRTVHPCGTVIVCEPSEPPLKLKPPRWLVRAAVTSSFTVFAAASYDMNLFTTTGAAAAEPALAAGAGDEPVIDAATGLVLRATPAAAPEPRPATPRSGDVVPAATGAV